MDIGSTVNLLKNQASTTVKERLQNQNSVSNTTTKETEDTKDTETTAAQDDIKKQGEDFDTFLTLLTAQIKSQDPLAPLDSTQFVEQLATFSGLELQAKGNNALDRIEKLLTKQIELITPNKNESYTSTKSTLA